ncbi:MAG: hypothetical protein ACYCZO_01650 [Daejeonella sp.]
MKTNYPDSLTIQQYLEGKLDPEVMHQLEKQALDDPFLWDALEGYSRYADSTSDLSILQRQLHERIVHLQENKKIFDLTWQRLSVAAAAAVLFITAGILFWMNGNTQAPENAPDPKQVEVTLSHPDSLLKSSAVTKEPAVGDKRLSADKGMKDKNEGTAAGSEITEGGVIQPDKTRMGADHSVARPDAVGEYSGRNSSAVENAVQPVAGWNLYRQYLQLRMRRPADQRVLHGAVLLTLDIAADGKILGVKIIKGLTEAYNLEAIRLVKEGPVWQGSADGQTKQVRLEVVF